MAERARGIAKAALESDPDAHVADHDAEILLICQGGARSLQAATRLAALGYRNIASVTGGTSRWIADGLPMGEADVDIDHDFHDRYSRHLKLPEVGLAGQQALEARARAAGRRRRPGFAGGVLPRCRGRGHAAPGRRRHRRSQQPAAADPAYRCAHRQRQGRFRGGHAVRAESAVPRSKPSPSASPAATSNACSMASMSSSTAPTTSRRVTCSTMPA